MKTPDELHTLDEWQAFRSQIATFSQGVIIFKFSPRCPISRSAERTFDAWYADLPEDNNMSCVKVDVVNSRPLSQHLAQEFQISHESPQLLWISSDCRVRWHASHYSITSDALDTQLRNVEG